MNIIKLLVFNLTLLISSLALACGETQEGNRIVPVYPVVGTDKVELLKVFEEILPKIGNRNILNITVFDSSCISINTGRVSGPKQGSGIRYTIEKKDEGWLVTNESEWIS
ncbi:MAG: hypothetical protein V7765_14960 [Oleispira sp.]